MDFSTPTPEPTHKETYKSMGSMQYAWAILFRKYNKWYLCNNISLTSDV